MNASSLIDWIETSKRVAVLDKLEYAFSKLDIVQKKSPRKLSSLEKNKLAMRFVDVNETLSKLCKVEKSAS
jgi:hypothetical protein